jgi:hypothetical protein
VPATRARPDPAAGRQCSHPLPHPEHPVDQVADPSEGPALVLVIAVGPRGPASRSSVSPAAAWRSRCCCGLHRSGQRHAGGPARAGHAPPHRTHRPAHTAQTRSTALQPAVTMAPDWRNISAPSSLAWRRGCVCRRAGTAP